MTTRPVDVPSGEAQLPVDADVRDHFKITKAAEIKDPEKLFHFLQKIPNGAVGKAEQLDRCGRLFLDRSREERNNKRENLNRSILSSKLAVQLTPQTDPKYPDYLFHSANPLLDSFILFQDKLAADQGISLADEALKLTPDVHPELPKRLFIYAVSLMQHATTTHNFASVPTAIAAMERAISLTADNNPTKSVLLKVMGDAYFDSSARTNDVELVSKAILAQEKAIQLTPDHSEDLSAMNGVLGNSFLLRFQQTEEFNDISQGITAYQRAINLAPASHLQLFGWSRNLANLFAHRFEITKRAEDVSRAIALRRRALELLGPSATNERPKLLRDMGRALRSRFELLGNFEDISEAISVLQSAIDSAPSNPQQLSDLFENLSNCHLSNFERGGTAGAISLAIAAKRQAVSLTPKDHPLCGRRLSSLGNSLSRRFERSGNAEDLSEAIGLHQSAIRITPDENPDKAHMLSNLGRAFGSRFEHGGDVADLTQAISALQTAMALPGLSMEDQAGPFNNLGIALRCRFDLTGDLVDISEAITVLQRAVEITPESNRELPSWLSNLSHSLFRRYERAGDFSDLEDAVATQKRAVELTPKTHSGYPRRASMLGIILTHRFQRSKDMADIIEAQTTQEKAVEATPSDHPEFHSFIGNLGNCYVTKFQHTQSITYLTKAIATHQKALRVCPEAHAQYPARLTGLASALVDSFDATGNIAELDEAIALMTRVTKLFPEGHARYAVDQLNLGGTLVRRFGRTKDTSDIQIAMTKFRSASEAVSGAPSIRLQAGEQWIFWSHEHAPSQTLEAYSIAIELLSHVAGMEQTIEKRHSNLSDTSTLASSAAAEALSRDEVDLALEWLEQGRCLVWTQLNQLRTPLDELHEQHSTLASRLSGVQRSLELSSSRSVSGARMETTFSQKMEIQGEANTHVKLAKEWEQILAEIRTLPNFHSFLRPRKAEELLSGIPEGGTTIILNAHPSRCDALALIPGLDSPIHIPLPDMTYQRAESLRVQLRGYLSAHGIRLREVDRGIRRVPAPVKSSIHEVLRDLWTAVVKPIFDALAIHESPQVRPRVWWCATGPFAFLPIHAAGIHQPGGKSASDFIVSSYTPTVSTMIDMKKKKDLKNDSEIMLLSQPYTPDLPPIPGTRDEVETLKRMLEGDNVQALHLDGSAATVTRVREEMGSHGWVHLACHASQETENSLQSGFYLHDGKLALSEIIKKRFVHADFAFLSACQTSAGDERLSEEAVHLAAGMLAAGYRGVVATMWSIQDKYGPMIAESFYSFLLTKNAERLGQSLDSADACYALDYATTRIRKELGDTEEALMTWVPYAHFGL